MSAEDRLASSLERLQHRLVEELPPLRAMDPKAGADEQARSALRKAFDTSLHPRAGHGQWASKGGPAQKPPRPRKRGRSGHAQMPKVQASVGITPFRPEDEVKGFYESPKFKRFQVDMRRIARERHVSIDHVEKAAGVWQGQTEPSLAVEAHDGPHGVRAWAAEMGKRYNQDGVLLFEPSEDGNAASYRFDVRGRDNQAVFDAMDQHGIPGGTLLDGELEVVGKGVGFHKKVDALSQLLGTKYDATVGKMTLLERGGYDDTIEKAERAAAADEKRAAAEFARQQAEAAAVRPGARNPRVGELGRGGGGRPVAGALPGAGGRQGARRAGQAV